jgi:hypothetical protein
MWRAYLLLRKLADDVPIEMCAVRIGVHELGIFIGREFEVTIDGATAKLEIQRLRTFGVSSGSEKTGVQKHPSHRSSFSLSPNFVWCGLETAHRQCFASVGPQRDNPTIEFE